MVELSCRPPIDYAPSMVSRIRTISRSVVEGRFGINAAMGSLDAHLSINEVEGREPSGTIRLASTSGMRDMGDTRPPDEAEVLIPLDEWGGFLAAVERAQRGE